MIGMTLTKPAVAAVSDDDEIGVREIGVVIYLGFKIQPHAEFAGALLQKQEKRAPGAAAETVAADAVDVLLRGRESW